MATANPFFILMYHSISVRPAPVCIPPAVFRQQLEILAHAGFEAVSLARLVSGVRQRDTASLPDRAFALTFDDGYRDFATVAYPQLEAFGWPATVFVPSGKVGGVADWDAGDEKTEPLPLLSWDQIRDLSRSGIEFGSHAVSHRRLTRLEAPELRDELAASKETIEQHVERPVELLAVPYGDSDPEVRREAARHYIAAVGTTLARLESDNDLYDLPRIEMWYFRNPRRWRRFVRGGATGYLSLRRRLRSLRRLGSPR